MRCFLAVDIGDETRKKILELQQKLVDYDVKLVNANNLHFTLKFLGDVSVADVEKIRRAVAHVTEKLTPFDVALKGVGVFPSMAHPRVLWVGATDREFIDLFRKVDSCLRGAFEEEDHIPHMTIARIPSSMDTDKLTNFVEQNRNLDLGKIHVAMVKLKMSTLTRQGPIYEDIACLDLSTG
jgi:RNA 2',3'-cyclic 3'-phosphodiesterase